MELLGLHVEHFRKFVVRPALQRLDKWTPASENLVLGTALQEGDSLRALKQYGDGPALGLFGMEPATHLSLWTNYIRYRDPLQQAMLAMATFSREEQIPSPYEMVTNLLYAAAMCRVRYLPTPKKLPLENDARGLAEYWKQYYNTPAGKGTVDGALHHFQRATKYLEVP